MGSTAGVIATRAVATRKTGHMQVQDSSGGDHLRTLEHLETKVPATPAGPPLAPAQPCAQPDWRRPHLPRSPPQADGSRPARPGCHADPCRPCQPPQPCRAARGHSVGQGLLDTALVQRAHCCARESSSTGPFPGGPTALMQQSEWRAGVGAEARRGNQVRTTHRGALLGGLTARRGGSSHVGFAVAQYTRHTVGQSRTALRTLTG